MRRSPPTKSIRGAEDCRCPAQAADIAVLKVARGISALLMRRIAVPVVSSALISAVGPPPAPTAAAALPELDHACGLGTGGLFEEDVAEPAAPVDGFLAVARQRTPARLQALRTPQRRQWWIDRVKACYSLLVRLSGDQPGLQRDR